MDRDDEPVAIRRKTNSNPNLSTASLCVVHEEPTMRRVKTLPSSLDHLEHTSPCFLRRRDHHSFAKRLEETLEETSEETPEEK